MQTRQLENRSSLHPQCRWRIHAAAILALFLICIGTYHNSLRNEFMMDDYGLILRDTKAHTWSSVFVHFAPDPSQILKIEDDPHFIYYRPLVHILIGIAYLCFGNNPVGYHMVNMFLYFLCALAFYGLLNVLEAPILLSFLSASLFLVHPINGFQVNYITAGVYSLQLFLMLLSLILAIGPSEGKRIPWSGFASLLLLALALLIHELAIMLPFFIAACLYLLRKKSTKATFWLIVPYLVVVAGYLILRCFCVSLKIHLWDKLTQFDMNVFEYWATWTRLITWYGKKLLLPDGIVLMWATPVIRDHVGFWIMGFFSLIIPFIYAITVCWKKDLRSLAMVWVILSSIPVTLGCLIEPGSGFIIETHWLLFGSLGFFILVSSLLVKLKARVNRRLWLGLVVVLMAALAVLSHWHNEMWRNEISYCRYWLENIPELKIAQFYLGRAYMNNGQYALARNYFAKAMVGNSSDYDIYNNLGLLELNQGEFKKAKEQFETALRLFPKSSVVHTNLGTVYLRIGKNTEAQEEFLKALSANPYQMEARLNLAGLYKRQGKIDEALKLYEESCRIDPQDARALYALAEMYWAMGFKQKAVALSKIFLHYGRDAQKLTNLGSLAAQHRFIHLALALYNKAMAINSSYPETYLEVGKLYGNLNHFDQALFFWREGLKKNPLDRRFQSLILQAVIFKEKEAAPPEKPLNSANTLLAQGKFSQAIELLKGNLKINSEDPSLLMALMNAYFTSGDNASAVALGNEILKSRNIDLLVNVGSFFAFHSFPKAAETFYVRALALNPDHANAHLEYGKLRGNQGRLRQAISLWQEGWKANPEDGRFRELILEAEQMLKEQAPPKNVDEGR